MKTLTVTLEQKIRLAWLIGQLSGNVALVKLALSVLEKLAVPEDLDDESFSVDPTNGGVTFSIKSPAVAKIIPPPAGKVEKPEELAAREEANAAARRKAVAENDAAIHKISSAISTVELTEAEADFVAAAMDKRKNTDSIAKAWIDGVVIADVLSKKEAAAAKKAEK